MKKKGIQDIVLYDIDEFMRIHDNPKYYYINGEKSNYIICRDGLIFKVTDDNKIKPIKATRQHHGYYLAHLWFQKKPYYRWVHRMVAETYIENPLGKPQVNHIDGDKSNNHVDNLEWMTSKENIQHAFRIKLRKTGEGSSNSKISKKDAIRICKLLKENKLTLEEIANEIGCTYTIVFMIYHKKTWLDISKKYDFSNYNKFKPNRGFSKLNEEKVHEICKLLVEGKLTGREIAKLYNVFENNIYAIKAKRIWKDITSQYNFN